MTPTPSPTGLIRIVATAVVALATGTLLAACTASAADSCGEFSAALSNASIEIVNSFALVDHNADEAIGRLEQARDAFHERRTHWDPAVDDAAARFEKALTELTAATKSATSGPDVDASEINVAVSDFEAIAKEVVTVCTTTPSPGPN